MHDHDFPSLADGVAIPYGVDELPTNRGRVTIGTFRNTPAFAAGSLARWWRREGRPRYPHASHLLSLAGNGGSNGAATALWLEVGQGNLAGRFGLYVTAGHYPAGASKWNTPERRLFSEISKRWAGEPLVDYSSVERLARETRTTPGLTVSCLLDARRDSQGIKLIPERLKEIRPHRHSVLPPWNGPILPIKIRISFCPRP